MSYPPHKSPSIVSRYWPMLKRALNAYPEIVELRSTNGTSFNTFVARFRDTIKALEEYDYPYVKLTEKQYHALSRIKTSVRGDVLLVGNPDRLKSANTESVGQMIRISGVDNILPLDAPSKNILRALHTLITHNIIDYFIVTGVDEEQIKTMFPDVNVMKHDNTLTIYV